MSKVMYALKTKAHFKFDCLSVSEEHLDQKIEKAYQSWKGMQPKGKDVKKEDFLSFKEKVKVTIENI